MPRRRVMPCRPARPPQGRAGSQQASGESQRKRGFERRRGLAHSGQRPRFAQKGRQRGGPRPGKARRWRAASTGGRHAGAVSTRTRRAGPRQRPRRRGRRRQQQLHEDAPRAARRRRLGQRLERSAVLGLACHGHPLHALRRAQQHPLARRCVQQGRMRRRPEYEQRRRQRPEAPGGDRQAAQHARPGKCTNSQEKPRKLQQDLEKGGAV